MIGHVKCSLGIALGFFLIPKSAIACECVQIIANFPELANINIAVNRAYEDADAVTLAKVKRIEEENLFGHGTLFQFWEIQSWKGEPEPSFSVDALTGSSCGTRFAEGEIYLLYLYRMQEDRHYGTSLCQRNAHVKNAHDDIEVLNRISNE